MCLLNLILRIRRLVSSEHKLEESFPKNPILGIQSSFGNLYFKGSMEINYQKNLKSFEKIPGNFKKSRKFSKSSKKTWESSEFSLMFLRTFESFLTLFRFYLEFDTQCRQINQKSHTSKESVSLSMIAILNKLFPECIQYFLHHLHGP